MSREARRLSARDLPPPGQVAGRQCLEGIFRGGFPLLLRGQTVALGKQVLPGIPFPGTAAAGRERQKKRPGRK